MRRRIPDLLIIALLFALPLIMFWNQTVGGRTLLPTENLYQYEPYASYRDQAGAPAIPYNHLVSDLVLQNMQWKTFIREQLAQGEFPLWNPHQFSGIAFLAAGQQSILYPFSILYYVLPLSAAYGWFTVVQLWLAGVFMLALVRGLGIGRAGGAVAGVTYQLAAFFVISAVFPMIIAAAVWLPLILLMIEWVIRRQTLMGKDGTLPFIALGALALACNILAGHVEITYYTLIVAAYYAAARLIVQLWQGRSTLKATLRNVIGRGGALVLMITLGGAMGAVQFLPLFEAANDNFRAAGAPFQQVLDWAHPARDIVQFIMPNFYGSPAQHTIFDVFEMRTVSLVDETITNAAGNRIVHTEWGMKNYVEAALYVGILPLLLAGIALYDGWKRRRTAAKYPLIMAGLALASLTFMFGLPTYALLYYTLPGIEQLHSPFRWVFPFTFAIAVLAAFGTEALEREGARWSRRLGVGLMGIGLLIGGGLVASRLLTDQVSPLVERLFTTLAKASDAFPDARLFYSAQFANVAIFAVVLIASGVVIFMARRRGWALAAVIVIAVDLLVASAHFNPASDPRLLDPVPPGLQWLIDQPGEWRYTTLEEAGKPPLLNANMTMRYGLNDIRGYESIIPKTYVALMETVYPQTQLEFNRVSPLYLDRIGETAWDRLKALNVRYLVTHGDSDLAELSALLGGSMRVVYQDSVLQILDIGGATGGYAFTTLVDSGATTPATVTRVSARELLIDVEIESPAVLSISERSDPHWRAYIRPQGATENQEVELILGDAPVFGRQMALPDAGAWTVRMVYSPASFQIGLFISFIAAVLTILLSGVWLWQRVLGSGENNTGIQRVARNSIAPILLNLFNRGIDLSFALVMLRILGPTDAGWYFYAGVVFVWFDIFTNFGLNLYLTREVARDRSRSRLLFLNTSALRVMLAIAGIPLLVGFLMARQGIADPPLTVEVILAILILYVGLLPNSLSTGFTALFYAHERAELPAAVATAATLNKVILGLFALLLGTGFVGLAVVSIVTNILTMAILAVNGRKLIPRVEAVETRIQPKLMRTMMGESAPLLFNHFLATIFFQIDVIIIEAIHGATMVGQYSVAYKWLTALNVIPSFFTQALLPVMARQAREDRAGLRQNYILAIKLLFSMALPIAIFFTFTAYFWAGVLGGSAYLPDGAIATQLIIWSIPIGWMNSLTQYALIALDLQRRLTRAFLAGVVFNIGANLLFVPQYGYQAAAVTTILSEGILFIGFAWLLRQGFQQLDPSERSIPWRALLWRPLVSATLMVVVMWVGFPTHALGAMVAGGVVYVGTLVALGTWDLREVAQLRRIRG